MKIYCLVLLIIAIKYANAQQSTACTNVAPGNFVQNSKSCNAYFYCGANHHAYGNKCPDGYLFNATTQICDHQFNVDCTVCSNIGIQNLVDPFDCNSYYSCVYGTRTHVVCHVGTFFDSETGYCRTNNGVACPPSVCAPYANAGVISIGDPYDCTVFHSCVHGVDYKRKCATNLLWNPIKKQCDIASNVPVCHGNLTPPTKVPTITTKLTTSEKPSQTTIQMPPTDCTIQTFWPWPGSCTEFIQCIDETPIHRNCSPGQYWYQTLLVCLAARPSGC